MTKSAKNLLQTQQLQPLGRRAKAGEHMAGDRDMPLALFANTQPALLFGVEPCSPPSSPLSAQSATATAVVSLTLILKGG